MSWDTKLKQVDYIVLYYIILYYMNGMRIKHGALFKFVTEAPMKRRRPASERVDVHHNSNVELFIWEANDKPLEPRIFHMKGQLHAIIPRYPQTKNINETKGSQI